jgi:methionyl aminopeptidase
MIAIKTPDEVKIMAEGGARLARVKNVLEKAVKVGVNALEIDTLATSLIKDEGAEVSFNKVPGYRWATCVTVNEGLVHGIPTAGLVFKKGDVVSVDVGVFHKGFHTDTSITVGLDVTPEVKKFLNVGKEALSKAISKAKVGSHLFEISKAIEDTIEGAGYSTVKALVGHGVGRELHEDPQIPCFVPGRIEDSLILAPGMVLAIEVMYAMGKDAVEVQKDGWTIAMQDGKISALFEETVAITEAGPKVLTR